MFSCCGWKIDERAGIVTFVVVVYFVIFPEDLGTLLAPVEVLLSLTNSVSGWFYGLLAVGLVCWTARAIFQKSDN